VRDAISGVQNETGEPSRGAKRKDCLDGQIVGRHLKGLEHDLSHFLAIGLGIVRRWMSEGLPSVRRVGCSEGVTLSSL